MTHEDESWGEKPPLVMVAQPQKSELLRTILRMSANLWIHGLMLVTAGLAVAFFIQMTFWKAELRAARQDTKAERAAVVAYRDALTTAIEQIDGEVVPAAPERPPLQFKLDDLQQRNRTLRKQLTDWSKPIVRRPYPREEQGSYAP